MPGPSSSLDVPVGALAGPGNDAAPSDGFWDEETAIDPAAMLSGDAPSAARVLSHPVALPAYLEEQPAPGASRTGGFRMGAVLSGRYRLDRLLSRGGMGQVHLASDLQSGEPVVLKALLPEASTVELHRRFEVEARACAAAASPHVVRFLASDYTPLGQRYHVFEYIEGRSLSRVLSEEGCLEPAFALELAVQIARGLGAVHTAGYVHRDLKPDNIILARAARSDEPPMAKIIDFGLVKAFLHDEAIAASAESDACLTQRGVLLGSPSYMAPEQIRNHEVGPATDLYALGTTLFQMLTGKTPFGSGDAFDVMHRQIFAEPPRLASVSATLAGLDALECLVARCLEKDAAERFRTAPELIEALEAARDAPRLPPPSLTSDLVLDDAGSPALASREAGAGGEAPVVASREAGAGGEAPVVASREAGAGGEAPVARAPAALLAPPSTSTSTGPIALPGFGGRTDLDVHVGMWCVFLAAVIAALVFVWLP